MKKLVWLLIFINIGLLTFFNLDRILPSTPKIKWAELNPEKISLLTQKQIEALPKKTTGLPTQQPSNPNPVKSCFEWGIFSSSGIVSAQSAIAKLSLKGTIKEQTLQESRRFWIYIPPLKTTQEAQIKAAEFKALGVEDLFVVQEPKWKNAISFGVFEDEKLALKLLNELKAKGIKDAVKTLRNEGKGHSSLFFSSLSESELNILKKLKPDFPEADLKEVACK